MSLCGRPVCLRERSVSDSVCVGLHELSKCLVDSPKVNKRGFYGNPDNRSRETAAVTVIKEQILQKHGKALVVYCAAHFYRAAPKDYLSSMGKDIGIARMLEIDYPGRTFAVIPLGGPSARWLNDAAHDRDRAGP
jgi:hypothetical protein